MEKSNKTHLWSVFTLFILLVAKTSYVLSNVEIPSNTPEIKSIVEEAKLVVSEVFAGDYFGGVVSMSGDYAVIGVSRDGYMGSSSGSAYIYHFDGNDWIQTQRLFASDSGSGHRFGTSVSISSTRVVIGAPGAGSNGQVYVFDFDGNNWIESQILTPTGHSGFSKGFGNSVSLSSNRILIGSSNDTEIGPLSGAAYVFEYVGGNWTQTQKITVPGIYDFANFGSSVSLYGYTAIVGAFTDENSGITSGSVYVFNLNLGSNTWDFAQKIYDPTGENNDNFGFSVSLYNTQFVVGTWRDNDLGVDSGSVSVYEYNGMTGSWEFYQKLSASDGTSGDNFGVSVSNSNGRIVVGAYQNDESGIANNLGAAYMYDFNGVDAYMESQRFIPSDGGNYNKAFGIAVALDRDTMMPEKSLIGAYGDDEMAEYAGSAYMYNYDGMSWVEDQKMIAGDSVLNDKFGSVVSISGETAVVGAYSDQDLGVDAGAVYVFDYVSSNWVLSQKIFGDDTAAGDFFGYSVSIENDRLVIGAQGDSDNGTFSGSVYVFERNGGFNWTQTDKLLASDAAASDAFGSDVSLSGDRILVGARFDNNSVGGTGAGSAYVFDYDSVNDIWDESEKLIAMDSDANDNFALSVSLDGDNAIIGAWADDDRGDKSGSAYIFNFDGMNWNQLPKLSPIETDAGDYFGFNVSIEGNWVVVGAPNEDDGNGQQIGAAYLFNFNGTNWVQTQRLTGGVGAIHFDNFGKSTAISGNRILISSYTDDDVGNNSGSVYEFKFNGVNWFENQKLTANDGADDDYFGYDVDISGNRALVGALGDDNNWIDDGAVYILNVADRYDLYVDVTGLAAGNTVSFSNGNDSITFNSDGQQIISNLADTSTYDVSVTQQPSFPDQVCTFDNPNTGTISGGDVIIDVTCTTIQFDLSVRVYGIAPGNSIEVTNNLGDNLVLDTHGEIKTFPTQVDHRDTFTIDLVSPQPTTPNQTCTTTSSGIMTGDVLRSFVCTTNQYSIGVNVTGLISGSEIVLQNNGGDDLSVTDNGSYNFATALDDESNYNVTILSQPSSPIQECFVNLGVGQLQGSDAEIEVTCNPSTDLIFENGFD
ncbi:MAG: FG-GAP repeat protein [Gammaproteobacteria bacterium]